jgi:hypothetical protein
LTKKEGTAELRLRIALLDGIEEQAENSPLLQGKGDSFLWDVSIVISWMSCDVASDVQMCEVFIIPIQ